MTGVGKIPSHEGSSYDPKGLLTPSGTSNPSTESQNFILYWIFTSPCVSPLTHLFIYLHPLQVHSPTSYVHTQSPIHLPTYSPVHPKHLPPRRLQTYLNTHKSIYLYSHLPTYLSNNPPTYYLPTYLPTYQLTYLPIFFLSFLSYLLTYLPTFLPSYLSTTFLRIRLPYHPPIRTLI